MLEMSFEAPLLKDAEFQASSKVTWETEILH